MELHTVEESRLVDLARLLLEEVCSGLVRFLHAREGPLANAVARSWIIALPPRARRPAHVRRGQGRS